jgi:hypothetical protein
VLCRNGLVRGSARVAVSAAVACSIVLRSATAAGGGCALSIRAEGLDDRWTGELDAVKSALDRRDDVDNCASIVLERAPAGARAIVVLKDGRSTERTLSDPRDLRAVVTALILVPAPDMPASREEVPLDAVDAVDAIDAVAPRHELAPEAAVARDQAPAAPPARFERGRRTRIDLGGFGGTRWSGGAPAGAVGLFADVRLGEWVLGVHGRWDGYVATSGMVDYTAQALAVGADFGRDFRLGATSLTVLAGPSFVSLSQKLQSNPPSVYVSAVNPKTGSPIGSVAPSAREGQVLRFGSAVRWNVLSREPMTLFVEADAEIDVTSDAGNTVPSALAATSPLPIWSAGLSLGGAVAVWP